MKYINQIFLLSLSGCVYFLKNVMMSYHWLVPSVYSSNISINMRKEFSSVYDSATNIVIIMAFLIVCLALISFRIKEANRWFSIGVLIMTIFVFLYSLKIV